MTTETTDVPLPGMPDEPPVDTVHGHDGLEGTHYHPDGDAPHRHESGQPEYVPDPEVQAFVTTVTMAVAHTNEKGPYQVIREVTAALEGLGFRGVVVGVAAVELRGDGGLIGL